MSQYYIYNTGSHIEDALTSNIYTCVYRMFFLLDFENFQVTVFDSSCHRRFRRLGFE